MRRLTSSALGIHFDSTVCLLAGQSDRPKFPRGTGLSDSSVRIRRLNLDLASELDHAVGWDMEEFGRRQRVAMHRLEQLDPDPTHQGYRGGNDGQPADEKRGIHHIEPELL